MAGKRQKKSKIPPEQTALRKKAEELLRKDAQALRSIPPADIEELVHELGVYHIELEMQNEELRKAQEELEAARDRYLDLYDFSPAGHFTLDDKGMILEANLTGARMLDVERRLLIKKPLSRFVAPDSQDAFYLHRNKVFGSEGQHTCELRFLRKAGPPFYGQLVSAAIRNDGGSNKKLRTAIIDITARKSFEKGLRESEEKYRSLVESTEDSIYLVDRQLRYLFVNRKHLSRFGLSMDRVEGRRYDEFHSLEETRGFRKKVQEVFKTAASLQYAYRSERDGGYFLRTLSPVIEDGNVKAVTVVSKNITEEKRTELALQESEGQKRAVLDATIDRIRYVDKELRIVWANKATVSGLDISPEAVVGQTCHNLFVGRDSPCEDCPATKALKTGQAERALMHKPTLKGSAGDTYWDVYCVPLRDDAGEMARCVQIARDITEQKRAEERIDHLTQQLLNAQEDERQSISFYLHDTIAQELSMAKIGCETLFKDQPEVADEVKEEVSHLSRILAGTIDGVRNLAYDLLPVDLERVAFSKAIYRHCEDFVTRNGLILDCAFPGIDSITLDLGTKRTLYRLIQEALRNIEKHADATQVTVKLIPSHPFIILRIEDDGKGFDLGKRLDEAASEGRMGILSMEKRVQLLKGEMTIRSRPMKGTRIVIKILYEEKGSA